MIWKSLIGTAFLSIVAAGESARFSITEGSGPNPALPEPTTTLLPSIDIAAARGWSEGAAPASAPDLAVTAFAAGLDHPRWLYVLPNGDVLVAETNAPPRPQLDAGVRGWIVRLVMRRTGAAAPSADRITLLRDADGDGRAEYRSVLLEGLRSPFGMALVGRNLYVANTDALLRFAYAPGDVRIGGTGEKIADLPAGPINQHWTKNVLANADGSRLYVTVGSNSNVAERGLEHEVNRAAILEIDPATRRTRVFASGLRNPNGLAWEPATATLWTVVNERDGLGSDVPPDYLTSVRRDGFYGWPYSYFGPHIDERVEPPRPDLVATAIVPDYALGPHTAPLGLAFSADAKLLPPRFQGGAFVGLHGSWNRRPPSGYKVIFVPFDRGMPAGPTADVLWGFTGGDGNAYGRPVGVAVDRRGALLVADDVGNVVWRVTRDPAAEPAASP